MKIQFLDLFVGYKGKWGFTFLKGIAYDPNGDVDRSFAEAIYDFQNKKWSVMLLWYQIV